MNSIEELLLQDIEAVAGEVVPTEQDLRDARAELERRVDVRRQRDRRRGVAVVAAAASVVVAVTGWQVLRDDKEEQPVGPITEMDSDEAFLAGDPPTTEQLLGVWQAHNPARRGILWIFTAEGEVGLGVAGNIAEDPAVRGTFEISGDAIEIEILDDEGLCDDKSWTLRTAVNEDGSLNVIPLDVDVANMCGNSVSPRWVLDRELPAPPGGEVLEPLSGAGWEPPSERAALFGTWGDPTGGYLLELRPDGSYTMLTWPAGTRDRGTWTSGAAATRLTLVSAGDSATCGEGDQLVLSDLRAGVLDEPVLVGDLERNDCQVPFEGTGWYRLGLGS